MMSCHLGCTQYIGRLQQQGVTMILTGSSDSSSKAAAGAVLVAVHACTSGSLFQTPPVRHRQDLDVQPRLLCLGGAPPAVQATQAAALQSGADSCRCAPRPSRRS